MKGETVYVRECAGCHMVGGSGVAGVYSNVAGNPIARHRRVPRRVH